MDRDGFSLLAMGFNGEKALRWNRSSRRIEAVELRRAETGHGHKSAAIT
jgi:hypothetical protein